MCVASHRCVCVCVCVQCVACGSSEVLTGGTAGRPSRPLYRVRTRSCYRARSPALRRHQASRNGLRARYVTRARSIGWFEERINKHSNTHRQDPGAPDPLYSNSLTRLCVGVFPGPLHPHFHMQHPAHNAADSTLMNFVRDKKTLWRSAQSNDPASL